MCAGREIDLEAEGWPGMNMTATTRRLPSYVAVNEPRHGLCARKSSGKKSKVFLLGRCIWISWPRPSYSKTHGDAVGITNTSRSGAGSGWRAGVRPPRTRETWGEQWGQADPTTWRRGVQHPNLRGNFRKIFRFICLKFNFDN